MNKWRGCKLGEVAEIIGGGTPKTSVAEYWNGDIPWLTPKDLSGLKGRFLSRGERNISEAGLKNSSAKLLPKHAVLLSSRAPVGYLAISLNEVTTNQGFRSLIPQSNTHYLFLYYLLKNNVDYLKSQSTGTTFGELAGSTLKSLSFTFPPLPEQKAIATVLSSLDDKIDLLHHQNKTLESLAETLYRQWFVEEANPEGNEVFLSDVSDHHKKNIKPFENSFQEYFHYSIPAFDDGQNPQIEVGDTIRSNKYQVLTNSILISKLNPRFPRVWQISSPIDEEVSICSTEFQVVVPNEPLLFPFIYYFLKSRPVTDELIGAAGGTSGSHQRASPDDIFNLSFSKPDDEKLKQFHQIVAPNLDKINSNKTQIQSLTNLRDTLLPKLMSGEVRVKNGK